jgi:hypothetical protein
MKPHLRNISVFETSLLGDSVPVNVSLVSSVLHDAKEKHGLSGSRLLLLSHGNGGLHKVSIRYQVAVKNKIKVALPLFEKGVLRRFSGAVVAEDG